MSHDNIWVLSINNRIHDIWGYNEIKLFTNKKSAYKYAALHIYNNILYHKKNEEISKLFQQEKYEELISYYYNNNLNDYYYIICKKQVID